MTLSGFSSSHIRKHQIAGADDHAAGNHKLFYSNGSGQLVELSLGEIGEALTAMGSDQAPVFAAVLTDNAIINGDFEIWQRGASFPAIGPGDFSADRWVFFKSGAMVHTIARSADVPTHAQSNHKSNYSIHLDCTTADASLAAGDYTIAGQLIEGHLFKPFVGNSATLSFWVKATKTGTYCVSFVNSGNDRSYVAEYTINSANTWEKKSILIPFTDQTGTWVYNNGIGIRIYFALACGVNFQGASDSWLSGLYFATSNQVNACDSVTNDFRLSQVKLQPGLVATPFQGRDIEREIALCQRYYQRFTAGTYTPLVAGVCIDTTKLQAPLQYFTKRSAPTFAYGGNWAVRVGSIIPITSISSYYHTTDHIMIECTVDSGLTAGNSGLVLADNDTSAYMELDAEL